MFTSNDDLIQCLKHYAQKMIYFSKILHAFGGKNVVLDFVAQIGFEIRLFSWSKTASRIAEFYDTCGRYCIFISNPVVNGIRRNRI